MQKSIRPRTKRKDRDTACGPRPHSEIDKNHWKFMNEQTRDKRTRQNPLVIPVRTRTRVKMEVVKTTIRKKSENVKNPLVFRV